MTTSVHIRLARSLYEQVKTDLRRPHPFAAERVGYLFTRTGTGPEGITLLFPVEYLALPDDLYVEVADPQVGAAISGAAIRSAMQRVLDTDMGALHVHLHAHPGSPLFSRIDWRDLPGMAQSLHNANPYRIHGALLLSTDAITGAVWLSGPLGSAPVVPRVSLVGYPLRIVEGEG